MSTKLKVNGNKIIKHNKIKARLGLTDKKNHSVFYLEGGTFITPADGNDDFNLLMDNVEQSCRDSIRKKLLNHPKLERGFLMNFEVCSDRMKKDKNSYLSFQYHFKQKNNANNSILDVHRDNEEFFVGLLNDIENQLTSHNIVMHTLRKLN